MTNLQTALYEKAPEPPNLQRGFFAQVRGRFKRIVRGLFVPMSLLWMNECRGKKTIRNLDLGFRDTDIRSRFGQLARYVPVSFLILVLLIISSSEAVAQIEATADLSGTVKDTSGAVVSGAKASITNAATGETRTATSDPSGVYRFVLLPPAIYSLQVTATGFTTAKINAVTLYIGQTVTEDVTLSPGAVLQTVTVEGTAQDLQTTSSNVGTIVTPTTVQSLPLNGRDFGQLATVMAPDAVMVPPYDPTKERYATFAVNGSSGRNVTIEVNGIDDKDDSVGGPDMQIPLSAVEEFNISTAHFSAENGRSEGGVVNVITKSGANQLHGGAYTFYTNTSLNADDYFSKQSSQPTPEFNRQQFGGDAGGPIRKDKDFFYGAIERYREQTALPVPSSIYQELVDAEPLGAEPTTTIATPFYEWRYNGRLDHHINANHTASLVYTGQGNNDLNDQSSGLNDKNGDNITTDQLILSSFNLTSVLNPHVVNSFTAGFQYWGNLIGLSTALTPYHVTFPSGAYLGTNESVPQGLEERKWQFKDEISVVYGHHTFRMGADYVWLPYMGGFFETGPVPNYTFLADAQTILANPSEYPQGFSTPGLVGTFSESSLGNSYYTTDGGQKQFGAFVEDDWEATKRLTLNVGLRWDEDYNFYEQTNNKTSRTYLELLAINSPYAGIPPNDPRGWQPRVGFSYNLHGGKHVIRGGYGIYFGSLFQNTTISMAQQSNPTIYYTAYSLVSTGPTDVTAPDMPGTNISMSQWRFGVSPFPPAAPLSTELAAGASGSFMDPAYRNPYSEQWNISYDYMPTTSSLIEVGYVHELGVHESGALNINPLINGVRPLSAAFAAAGVPVLGSVVGRTSTNTSNYNALNITYRRKMANHFTVNANYVLSRSMAWDGNSAAFGNESVNPLVPFQKAIDYGPTPSNETHEVSASGIVDLRWGFNVAPIMIWSSAFPYNCTEGIDFYGFGSGQSAEHCVVLNNAPTNLTATKSYTSSQILSCLGLGTCTQLGYDALHGDPYFDLDARVGKALRWHEHYDLNLFFQGFDLTNRANFGGNYTGSERSSAFEQPAGYIGKTGVVIPKSFRAEFGFQFAF
jgi:hypothetical protein